MSKAKAITLAAFTAWPLVYTILLLCMVLRRMMHQFLGGMHPWRPSTADIIILQLDCLTFFGLFTLFVIYFVHLSRTDRVPQNKKALWAGALFFGNVFAMPVYWYLYIWKEPSA
jgi:hypothetical protein